MSGQMDEWSECVRLSVSVGLCVSVSEFAFSTASKGLSRRSDRF